MLGETEAERYNHDKQTSVMGHYLQRVQERLKTELNSKTRGAKDQWLLAMLKEHGNEHRESFVLRASDAKRLQIKSSTSSTLRTHTTATSMSGCRTCGGIAVSRARIALAATKPQPMVGARTTLLGVHG